MRGTVGGGPVGRMTSMMRLGTGAAVVVVVMMVTTQQGCLFGEEYKQKVGVYSTGQWRRVDGDVHK